jgi:hypothetical protein
MRRLFGVLSVLALALALPAASLTQGPARPQALDGLLILTQSSGGDYSGGDYSGCDGDCGGPQDHRPDASGPAVPPGTPPDAVGITPETTQSIVDSIAAATLYCQKLDDPALSVDCLAEQLQTIGKNIPYQGGYSSARLALMDAAAKLHALAVANASTTRPPVRPDVKGQRPHRALQPVDNTAAVAAKAAAILQDTTLVLLRSSSGSEQRRAAYETVATALGSTKVLLRSA